MDSLAISRAPAGELESPSRSDAAGWRIFADAARGTRRLRVDAAGRPAELIDACGTALAFTHDAGGSLQRIASGDWSLAIAGQSARATFGVTDPGGETALRLAREGRVRTLARGGAVLTIELDALERVRRVTLPGSPNPLAYEWDETGGCVVRCVGGDALLTLSGAGTARRIALDERTWWDETVQPTRATLEATVAGAPADTLAISLDSEFAIVARRWADGSGDRFERDDRRRLSAWITVDADGSEARREWRYAGDHLADDGTGAREIDAAGRVRALDGGRITYRHDAAGRRIARVGPEGETRYTYDPLGTLARVVPPDGVPVRIATDGTGRRVALSCGDETRVEHRDETGRLWAVTDADGPARHVYIWIGDRIAGRIDGAVGAPLAEAYLTDPLGTPNGAFVAERGGGWRFARLDAPPYGRTDDALRPTLHGHFADPATSLIHFGARDFDPETALFLTPDPWHGGEDDPRRWAGATDAMLARERERPAAGFHDYALCRFDPLGRADRDGHVSTGDVFLHILRWVLLPTWGFPLTAVSLFFFQPINLYMELVGLIVWGFKAICCEDKSHPWGYHTIVKATGLLGSTRQFTFAFGLNGFLPRVISGGGPGGDRAVTVGNVIWINRNELGFLGRAEVIEVDDVAGGPAGPRFNDDPRVRSVAALSSVDRGVQHFHVSPWTRGFGNGVEADALGNQRFVDRPATAGASAPGTLHLRLPLPEAMPVPHEAGDGAKLALTEYLHKPGDPTALLEVVDELGAGVMAPLETGFAKGDWLRITAPKAKAPALDPAFVRIREKLPAKDHSTLHLTDPIPARFRAASLAKGLRIEALAAGDAATASGGWAAAGATLTLAPVAGVPLVPPAWLAIDGIVRIVAGTPAAPPAGAPAGTAGEDTRFTRVVALRVVLTLAPDAGGAAPGGELRLRQAQGALFHGAVDQATPATIALATPHPAIAKDDLLVVRRAGVDPVPVRATAPPAGQALTVDPPLPATLASGPGTIVDLQATADSADAGDKGAVAAVAAADVTLGVTHAATFAAGGLVRIGGATPALRRIAAIARIEADLADAPVGTGPFVLTGATPMADRVLNGASLAPPGLVLKWQSGTALASFGTWPAKLHGIEYAGFAPGGDVDRIASEVGTYYMRWPGDTRPAGIDPAHHHVWKPSLDGGDQLMTLEAALPIRPHDDDPALFWRPDAEEYTGTRDVKLSPLPGALTVTVREYSPSPAVRADKGDRRVLAQEPELLVPDDPTVHDTHRRALIEHETHHTVQCNFWGPLMGAFPLQGLIMTAFDFRAAGGDEPPDWLQQVDRDAHGNPPVRSAGRIDHNTELNPFQTFSLGGMMQLAWKYVLLDPFRASPALAHGIDDLDFEDFNKVFNPVSRIVTQHLPQIDASAPAGQRWQELLGQLLSKGLDLRSWTAFLGFVPFWLPDGAQNFIEQGASRASGDLYSTILTANDRYNFLARGRLFGSHTDRSADLHAPLGRPLRFLMFAGDRTDRVLAGAAADVPGATVVLHDLYALNPPITMTILDPALKVLFPTELYYVFRPAAPAPAVTPPIVTLTLEGPADPAAPARAQRAFATAQKGDLIFPRMRALVPMPPRVNRTSGCYLIAGSPGRFEVAAYRPSEVDAIIALGGNVTAGATVEVKVKGPGLDGAPERTLGTYTAVAADTLTDAARKIAAMVNAAQPIGLANAYADTEDTKVRLHAQRISRLALTWTVTATGGLEADLKKPGKAAYLDPHTETVTVTIADEVKLGPDPLPWTEPAAVGAMPAAATLVTRFATEEAVLKVRQPENLEGPAFEDAGIAGLVLEIDDPKVTHAPLPDRTGWTLTMPKDPLAAPTRLRLYRVVKKDDPAFDLAFADVPTLANARSYLADDMFVVVRDLLLGVDPLPELPAAEVKFDEPFLLKLPIRMTGFSVAVSAAGAPTLPIVRTPGDDGRTETWRIGPRPDAPAAATIYTVMVFYGRPGNTVLKKFALTLKPA